MVGRAAGGAGATGMIHEYGMSCDPPAEIDVEWVCGACGATFRARSWDVYQDWGERS